MEFEKCKEALVLLEKVYQMEYKSGDYLLVDYYKAKGDELSLLVSQYLR